jgi:hypothetical protein
MLQIYGHALGEAHREAVEKVAPVSGLNRAAAIRGFNRLAVCTGGFDSHRPLQITIEMSYFTETDSPEIPTDSLSISATFYTKNHY